MGNHNSKTIQCPHFAFLHPGARRFNVLEPRLRRRAGLQRGGWTGEEDRVRRDTVRPGTILSLPLFPSILAFFVFLNSISSFEKNKSYDVAKSVRANFANFAGKGDNVDLIGKAKNDKINVNTVKALENTFNLVIPTIAVKKNNQSDNIEFNIPLESFFDLSSGLPTKTAKVILNEIGGVLKLKVDKQPIKLEIFMGYRFLSNGLKLDERLKSKVTFLVDTLLQAGTPKGLFSIGLEPQNQEEIRFRFSIAQSQNGHHDGAS